MPVQLWVKPLMGDQPMGRDRQILVSLKALQQELGGQHRIQDKLFKYAKTGDVQGLRLLIAAGADPNSYQDDREHEERLTPLITAVVHGQAASVKELIAAEVDLNGKDAIGRTALMWAMSPGYDRQINKGRVACAKLLIAAGADLDATDKYDQTALTIGEKNTYSGHILCVGYLKRAGAINRDRGQIFSGIPVKPLATLRSSSLDFVSPP
jgi:ankyrin repeat protein